MKTIFFYISTGFVAKNVLQTDIFKYLKKQKNLRIVLFAPGEKAEYYQKSMGRENVIVESIPESFRSSIFEYYYWLTARSSIHTCSASIYQYRDYFLDKRHNIFHKKLLFLLRRVSWFFGQFNFWRRILGAVYPIFFKKTFSAYFEKYNPDLVYLFGLFKSQEWLLLKEAKNRKIKTIYSVAGWDNPTTKIYLPIFPDYILAQNNIVKDELARYSLFPKERIYAVGYPQYDRYFKKTDIIEKGAFLKKIKAESDKKIILYGMINPKNFSNEINILKLIDEFIRTNGLEDEWQVLIRPYPSQAGQKYREEELARRNKNFIFDYTVVTLIKSKYFEFSEDDSTHLANSLYHADIVIAASSTILMEAAIFNKPIINIGFSGEKENRLDYYSSPRRYLDFLHIKNLSSGNKLINTRNKEDLFKAMKRYTQDLSLDSEKREAIVKTQCLRPNGDSGLFTANTILKIINKDYINHGNSRRV